MTEYYTPTLNEFRLAASREFAYLVSDFGFKERPPPPEWTNPYFTFFGAPDRFVYVEGITYGVSLSIRISPLSGLRNPEERIDLSTLMALHAPDLLEPRYPDKRGQLESMKFAAAALRRCAPDLLMGNFSALPEMMRFQAQAQSAAREAAAKAEAARAFMLASDAFHSGRFDVAVELLAPHSEYFGKMQRTMLNLAKKRAVTGR